jgi:GH15 family glucan-1,4-alpha-glucosidase
MLQWAVAHQLPGGLLSEQIDPNTGAPLSVSPLTWSHAEFVITVDDYLRRLAQLAAA